MKKYTLLIVLSILFGIANAQQANRISSFFNDSLKGKWIIDKQCVSETGDCDTSNRNKEYLVFKTIDENDFVLYETNQFNVIKSGLTKLYLPDSTSGVMIKYSWTLDAFLFSSVPKVIIGFNGLDHLSLLENTPIPGYINFYFRDTTYTNISLGSVLKISDRITVCPNPSDGDLFIKNEYQGITAISIFDMYGNKVKEVSLAPNEERRLNLRGISNGAYNIQYRNKFIVGGRLLILSKK